ncbi:MAG TPA: hypothetical protein VIQ54_25540, partial [Polyangia bacterium]
ELAAESHQDQQRASLRGHLELAAAAPFARAWFKELAGSLEVDLSATAAGDVKDIAISGNVAVATPLSVTLADLPVHASIPGGRLSVTNNVIDTAALPVILHAEGFPVAAVSKIDAKARLTGRIDAMSPRAKYNAHLALENLDVHVPLIGRNPIHAAGGMIDVVGEAGTGKVDLTRIDLPISAEVERLAATAGVMVDRAKVALRVRGTARQLALSGDVDLGSAHIRADALQKSGGGGKGGGDKKKGPLADHPEIEAAALDIRVRSSGGAVSVDVNNIPDLRVDVDMHVGGTVKKPSITGTQKGANIWSSFVLALVRLFT